MGSDMFMEQQFHRPRQTLAFFNGRSWEVYSDYPISGYVLQGKILKKDITERALKTLGVKKVLERPTVL